MEVKNPLKVLVVSCAGPPKGSTESLQVSKYLKYLLKQKELCITLVTERLPNKNFGWRTLEQEYTHVLQELHQVINVPVYYNRFYFALLKRIRPSTFYRPDNEALFIRSYKKIVNSLTHAPEVIYSRSTPFSSAVLALRLKNKFRVPWLMHLSDPWVESPLFSIPPKYHDYHIQMEMECFDNADKVSFTSEETLRHYSEKYPQHKHKMVCFPNVYDDDSVTASIEPKPEKLRLVHTGNFYGIGRRPRPLLQAWYRLEQEFPEAAEGFEMLFTGFQDATSKQDFQEFPCKTVKHLGAISLSAVRDLQKSCDLLLLIDWELPKDLAMFQLSKTVDYLAAGKPILAITTKGSTVYNIVEGSYGRCLQHNDRDGIYQLLKTVIQNGRSCPLLNLKSSLDHQYAASFNAINLKNLLLEMYRNSSQEMTA